MMPSTLANTFAQANHYFNTAIAEHFHAIDSGHVQPALFIIALAFGYGVVHALGPGHGKALVAGYLLANPSKRSHVFQIGFLIALVHTLSALVVTLCAAYLMNISANRLFRDVNPPLFQISGGLIVLLGCWLVYNVFKEQRIVNEPVVGTQTSRFGVVMLAGVVPCPGVITLSFFAITLGHMGIGMIAAFFMSLGMGLTISLAGLLAQSVQASKAIETQPKWFWAIRFFGAVCVVLLGLWFLTHPIPQRAF